MKKIICLLLAVVSLAIVCTGCTNQQIVDLNYKFDYALINCGDQVIKVSVAKWKEYDDSDAIQIISKEGTVYYTHLENVIMIHN